MTHQKTLRQHTTVLIGFSLLVLAIVGLHSAQFENRNYRQDEAWTVHWALLHAKLPGGVPAVLLNNITQVTTQYWVMDVWVNLFGQTERITRFASTLLTAITLALVFRLSKDLFDWRVGLFAMFALGTLSIFEFFTHETRAYAALVAGTIALLLLFERWLVTQRWRYAVAYVIVAVATVYIHVYVIYVIAAEVVFGLLFVRWNRHLWLRTFAMFAVTALLALPRFYQIFFLFNGDQGGIDWYSLKTNSDSLTVLHDQLAMHPVAIGQFLFLVGLAIPVAVTFPRHARRVFRLPNEWRRLYVITIPVTILIMAFAVNIVISNVTPRNMIVILPSLAILIGYALVSLPWQARAVLVLMIALPAVTHFQAFVANGPYQEMTAFIQKDVEPTDRFVIEGASLWQHVPMSYYVQERLSIPIPNESQFHLLYLGGLGMGDLPDPPVHWAVDDSAASMDAFRAFIDDAQRVWYLQGDPVDFVDDYQAVLSAGYVPYRSESWGIEQNYAPYTFIEYRRIPAQLEDSYTFGDNFQLRHWELKNSVDVTSCTPVTVESWWSVRRTPTINYSMTLALANQQSEGIARNDGAPSHILPKLWQPNRLYLDSRTLTVPCDAQPGDYPLIINLYNYDTLESLPLTSPAQSTTAYLTTLHMR